MADVEAKACSTPLQTDNPSRPLQSIQEDADRNGDDLVCEMRATLASQRIQALRKFASRAGVDTTGSKQDLAARLVEAGVFQGPLGDDAIYQETDDGATKLSEWSSYSGGWV